MNEDLVIKKLVNLEQDMIEVKKKVNEHDSKLDKLLIGQDEMIGLMKRWDEERIHMNQKITELDEDVSKIKFQLKLA